MSLVKVNANTPVAFTLTSDTRPKYSDFALAKADEIQSNNPQLFVT
jgi:hypothetical protein